MKTSSWWWVQAWTAPLWWQRRAWTAEPDPRVRRSNVAHAATKKAALRIAKAAQRVDPTALIMLSCHRTGRGGRRWTTDYELPPKGVS